MQGEGGKMFHRPVFEDADIFPSGHGLHETVLFRMKGKAEDAQWVTVVAPEI